MSYCIGQSIGTGGFGTVYSGCRRSDNAPVAIKHIAKSRVSSLVEVNQLCNLTLNHVHNLIRILVNR